MRRTVVKARPASCGGLGGGGTRDDEDLPSVYKQVCKVEYSHSVDRGVLHQLDTGVLRIDVDAFSVHELQVFKGFFSHLPRLRQLCVAHGQVALKHEPELPSRPGVIYGSSAVAGIQHTRANAVKKATQGILQLVCKLLRTPRHCKLVSLALPGMNLTDATIANLEESFRACSTLRELDFREQDLSRPSVAERMLRAVKASATVQAVCLRSCGIGTRSARFLGQLLRSNNERRDELIWKGGLRGEDASKQAIRLQGLVVLDVSDNDLGAEGVAEILEVLENDRWMAAINLAGNNGSDGGAAWDSTLAQAARCFKINRACVLWHCCCCRCCGCPLWLQRCGPLNAPPNVVLHATCCPPRYSARIALRRRGSSADARFPSLFGLSCPIRAAVPATGRSHFDRQRHPRHGSRRGQPASRGRQIIPASTQSCCCCCGCQDEMSRTAQLLVQAQVGV
jgi:hypothetical protein